MPCPERSGSAKVPRSATRQCGALSTIRYLDAGDLVRTRTRTERLLLTQVSYSSRPGQEPACLHDTSARLKSLNRDLKFAVHGAKLRNSVLLIEEKVACGARLEDAEMIASYAISFSSLRGFRAAGGLAVRRQGCASHR